MVEKSNIDWLIVLPSDYLGGSEQLLYNLADYLSANGLSCAIIILTKKNTGLWGNLETRCAITYLPFKNLYRGYINLISVLIKYSRQHKIVHILASQTLINGLLGFTKKIGFLKKTRLVVRESTSIFHRLKGLKLKMYKASYNLGYSKADLVICQTDFMKTQLIQALPWIQKKVKIVVLHNPINLTMVDQMAKKEMEKIPEINNHDFLVTAGRLISLKGFDVLIKALNEIRSDFPNLNLLILGEGPERNKLEELANDLNMKERVVLLGHVKNVYPYFRLAKACVVSSRIEGFPNVLLQMMSQNSNVVSTICAGGIDKIEGVVKCKPDDIKSLASALKECLRRDDGFSRQIFDDFLKNRNIPGFMNEISSKMTN
ncbi:glycosyltransferase [Flavobacteriaceae bacterium TP-CH-4]|uniref:Glycosyltransferase n=1 Tax=Pelagihabitans pacificus TaxID=2696054 RepID=A0A967E8Q6_9FLAO|nr:glycosyltransferase [Pelagihabitans pacificus]NHF61534.1 glycosyltransferase [Pelagihabitans pacificus]